MQDIRHAFEQSAHQQGGQAEVTFTTHSTGYAISEDEPLLQTYRAVLAEREAELQMQPTFIGSDTSGFRPKVQAFTISTGIATQFQGISLLS